jgi:phosphoglycolate phosphatase-like HAD superfamily hydrolase
MRFDVVVFDFDGTLVDSAPAKRDSFFAIFPASEAHRAIVAAVLNEDPDGSRHRVIPLMAQRMTAAGLDPGASGPALVQRYGDVSEAAVAAADELPGATALLAALARHIPLHVCSNTPEETVRAHASARGWSRYFRSVDGYPTSKTVRVAEILASGGFAPQRLAVVGDGISDEAAARDNGCIFLAIRAPGDLGQAGRIITGESHV